MVVSFTVSMTRNACEMCALRETSRTLDACILLSCLPQKLYIRSQLLSNIHKKGWKAYFSFLSFSLLEPIRSFAF